MSISLAGSGGGDGVKFKSDGNFLPLLELSTLKRMNRIFLVALAYCDKMSTIASFGGLTLEGSLKA